VDPQFDRVAIISTRNSLMVNHLYAIETYHDAPVFNAAIQAVQLGDHELFRTFDARCQTLLKGINDTIAAEKRSIAPLISREAHELGYEKLFNEIMSEVSKFEELQALLNGAVDSDGDDNTVVGDHFSQPDQGMMIDGVSDEKHKDSEIKVAGAFKVAGIKTEGSEGMVKNGNATTIIDSKSSLSVPLIVHT
jgi:hypothetical protein